MNVPPSARWCAYALAGALTLGAVAWVSDEPATAVVQPSQRSAAPAAAAGLGAQRADGGAAGLVLPTARQARAPTADPFAVIAAAPDEVAAGRASVAPAPAPRSAPSAPALPFVYLGSWKEHGKTAIFVQRDDRAYKIAGPGPLDAEYAVRSVEEDRITLNYLPLGIVQELRLDAPAVERAVASAPPVRNSPEPDMGEN